MKKKLAFGGAIIPQSMADGGPVEDPNKIYKATQDLPEVTVTAPRTLSGAIAKAHENDSPLGALLSPLTVPLEVGSRLVGHMISGNYEMPSEALARTRPGQYLLRQSANPMNVMSKVAANPIVQDIALDPLNLAAIPESATKTVAKGFADFGADMVGIGKSLTLAPAVVARGLKNPTFLEQVAKTSYTVADEIPFLAQERSMQLRQISKLNSLKEEANMRPTTLYKAALRSNLDDPTLTHIVGKNKDELKELIDNPTTTLPGGSTSGRATNQATQQLEVTTFNGLNESARQTLLRNYAAHLEGAPEHIQDALSADERAFYYRTRASEQDAIMQDLQIHRTPDALELVRPRPDIRAVRRAANREAAASSMTQRRFGRLQESDFIQEMDQRSIPQRIQYAFEHIAPQWREHAAEVAGQHYMMGVNQVPEPFRAAYLRGSIAGRPEPFNYEQFVEGMEANPNPMTRQHIFDNLIPEHHRADAADAMGFNNYIDPEFLPSEHQFSYYEGQARRNRHELEVAAGRLAEASTHGQAINSAFRVPLDEDIENHVRSTSLPFQEYKASPGTAGMALTRAYEGVANRVDNLRSRLQVSTNPNYSDFNQGLYTMGQELRNKILRPKITPDMIPIREEGADVHPLLSTLFKHNSGSNQMVTNNIGGALQRLKHAPPGAYEASSSLSSNSAPLYYSKVAEITDPAIEPVFQGYAPMNSLGYLTRTPGVTKEEITQNLNNYIASLRIKGKKIPAAKLDQGVIYIPRIVLIKK